jgi:hypothetical protein
LHVAHCLELPRTKAGVEGTAEHQNTIMLMGVLDKNNNDKVSNTEFKWAMTKAPDQMFAALTGFQAKMRKSIGTEKGFWAVSILVHNFNERTGAHFAYGCDVCYPRRKRWKLGKGSL